MQLLLSCKLLGTFVQDLVVKNNSKNNAALKRKFLAVAYADSPSDASMRYACSVREHLWLFTGCGSAYHIAPSFYALCSPVPSPGGLLGSA